MEHLACNPPSYPNNVINRGRRCRRRLQHSWRYNQAESAGGRALFRVDSNKSAIAWTMEDLDGKPIVDAVPIQLASEQCRVCCRDSNADRGLHRRLYFRGSGAEYLCSGGKKSSSLPSQGRWLLAIMWQKTATLRILTRSSLTAASARRKPARTSLTAITKPPTQILLSKAAIFEFS